jgi:uncharacterized protein YfaS (alpha-2-macroglobulin family)
VAFWSGLVTADGQGKARVSFDVPEFRGAVRIMVVAADGKRFGSAEATTRVKSPLSLSPSFPRVLSLDETVDIPVAVRNDTPQPGGLRRNPDRDRSGVLRRAQKNRASRPRPGKNPVLPGFDRFLGRDRDPGGRGFRKR